MPNTSYLIEEETKTEMAESGPETTQIPSSPNTGDWSSIMNEEITPSILSISGDLTIFVKTNDHRI